MTVEEMNTKIELLLGQLTLREKVSLIHGNGLFQSGSVERLGIPSIKSSDGPMGVRHEFYNAEWRTIGHSDDYVTYCPSNSAIAATWNETLAYESGKVLGEEARGRGKDIILAPGINVIRVPACGRNFEYMSEDPCLIAKLTVPLIKGIQESDVAACVKHFALNNQETERLYVNVEIDERALREIYLPGFEAAVKQAKSYSIMGAYNLFRGIHCCHNKELLFEILRKEWNYDGMIVSDWGAVHKTKAAAESPLDLEMSVGYAFDNYYLAEPLLEAVEKGEIAESVIDEKVKNILRLMLRIRMIDVVEDMVKKNPGRKPGCYNTEEHRKYGLRTARESIVLLKNTDGLLPLQQKKLTNLLVIGDNAERLQALGGGSAEIKALYEISPLMGLKSQLGGNCEVTFARGYYVSEKEESEINWQETSVGDELGQDAWKEAYKTVSREVQEKQKELRKEAVMLAKEAEQVILIGGLNHDYDVEGYDRDTMELPYDQDLLIEEVLKVCPNAIIVMMTGNAVSMGKWKDRAKAIVWMSYSGMEGGNALAEVLLGKINPSGKLPISFPYRMEDCGAIAIGEYPGRKLSKKEKETMDAHITENYQDGIYVGYRYYETNQIPVQYCFGHGLSYTSFEYENLIVESKAEIPDGLEEEMATVKVTITNSGKVAGKEVIQIYVGMEHSCVERPVKELRAFRKIALKPGECKEVTLSLTKRAFTYYDEIKREFVVEQGTYNVYVGSSLKDIRLQQDVPVVLQENLKARSK